MESTFCFSNKISFLPNQVLPTEIQAESFNSQDSIYSVIKLNTPLNEIYNEKYFGSKRSFPRHLFYFNLYAFAYTQNYLDIDLEKYSYKTFPQTHIEFNFMGGIFSVNSLGQLKNKNQNIQILELNIKEDTYFYQISISNICYIFVLQLNKKIEIDGNLKSSKSFDIVKAFQSKLLFIKNNEGKYLNIKNNNEKNSYILKKNMNILLDYKYHFSIDLISQMLSHDKILSNLYKSCNENLENFYYIGILTEENKTEEKSKKIIDMLQKSKFNLNVLIFIIENDSICGQEYQVVIDKEYLHKDLSHKVKDLSSEVKDLSSEVKEVKLKVNEIDKKLDSLVLMLNKNIDSSKNENEKYKTKISEVDSRILSLENDVKQAKDDILEIKGLQNGNRQGGFINFIYGLFGY